MSSDKAFYETLGRRIEVCRIAKDLTQAKLGQLLVPPMTRAGISNIEKGRQRVLAHTLCALADALGVTLYELVPPSAARSTPHQNESVQKSIERLLPKDAAQKMLAQVAGSSSPSKARKRNVA